MIGILVAIALAICLVAWVIITVTGLRQLALLCDDSWADVVSDLKMRHELVPRLVATARPLLSEHAELLDGMLRASQEALAHKAPPGERGLDESAVSVTLQRLLVLVEQRPTLKDDPEFQRLRKELMLVEERIQSSRRYYNTSAKDLFKRSRAFPAGLIAGSEVTSRREVFELLPVGLAGPNGHPR